MATKKSLEQLLQRLCALSAEHAYDPYRHFDWPQEIRHEGLWMSADLLSVAGTAREQHLSPEQLRALSRFELVNFFSFNVNGIRELMLHVLGRIHTSGFALESDYFHYFLDEENKHMWFFAEFCRRYAGKIYPARKLQFSSFSDDGLDSFVAFSKILISEQISDFYNVRMMGDTTLPSIVRAVNRVHHEDESRHISMGRRVVRKLYEGIASTNSEETLARVKDYIGRYMTFFVESFYNPVVYRDAGLSDPYELRRSLVKDPRRAAFHARALRAPLQFFQTLGLEIPEVALT